MIRNRFLKSLALLSIGAIPLVTQASCDPYGASFFRDDDEDDIYDVFYYDDPYYYDDCCYYDEVYVEEIYYGP